MDAHIRAEFGLSTDEYDRLLTTLQARFGVRSIEDVAFLSAEQLVGVTDRWEAAAVKRLFDIVTAHIGVEKLHRFRAVSGDPGLAQKTRNAGECSSPSLLQAAHKKPKTEAASTSSTKAAST